MKQKLIYLDNCCFNRPYDSQDQLSIYLETQAKLSLQEALKNKNLILVWSFILDFENSKNPDNTVKSEIFTWRKVAGIIINNNKTIMNRSEILINSGFDNKDSLHISSAIFGEADFFITVDKGILKRKDIVKEIKIINPIEMVAYFEENFHEI